MPQGSSAAPGWFVKVFNEAIKDLDRVAAYLNDVVVYDPEPAAHVANIRSLFERLRKHNLKRLPSEAQAWRHRRRLPGTHHLLLRR